MGPSIPISTDSGDENNPSAASIANPYWNGSVVVWQRKNPTRLDFDIYGQRIAFNGLLDSFAFGISTWELDQLVPDIACGETCVVVYEDHHWGNGIYWWIHGAVLNIQSDSSLDVEDANFGIDTGGVEHPLNPVITLDVRESSGEEAMFMAAWEYELSCSNHNIYLSQIRNSPDPYVFDPVKLTDSMVLQKNPALAGISHGNTYIIWEDGRNEEEQGFDLYASGFSVDIWGFESGKVEGWTAGGTGAVEALTFSNITPGITPPQGEWMALLSTGPGHHFSWEGDLNGNTYNDWDAAILSTTFELSLEDVPTWLSFEWAFITGDYLHDDFFMVTLDGTDVLTGSVPGEIFFPSKFPDVASLDGIDYEVTSSGPTNGSYFGTLPPNQLGRTGFQPYRMVIDTLGLHTLAFLVADQGEDDGDSGLLVDNVTVVVFAHMVECERTFLPIIVR